MNELKVINQQEVLGKDFKIYGTYESPLFLAKDVAEWIDYSFKDSRRTARDISKMLQTVDDEEKLVGKVFLSGQNRDSWFVSEEGLYEVLMQSTKPIAKEFKKQVKSILKDIRRTGMYATDDLLNNPDLLIQVATALKEEREKSKTLEATVNVQQQLIGELKPKADYTDKILSNKGLVSITQISKDYGMSGYKMNKLLHDLGIQYKCGDQWLLYGKHQSLGYTHSKTIEITRTDGRSDVVMETKWTQKGRLFLYDLLKQEGILPMIEK